MAGVRLSFDELVAATMVGQELAVTITRESLVSARRRLEREMHAPDEQD